MAFIPLYDGTRLRHIRHAYVAWGLIAANFIVFLLVEGGAGGEVSHASVGAFSLVPAEFNAIIERGHHTTALPDALRLITYAFLHGGWMHLLGNMLFVWVFADDIEDALGHARFLLFYLLCGIGGGYAYVWSDPSSEAAVIGASGAIAGIIAAYLMLHPFARVWVLAFGRIPLKLPAYWVLGFWALFQVYAAFAATDDEIAWWSHLGGAATGAVLVPFLKRRGIRLFAREPAPVGVDGMGPPG